MKRGGGVWRKKLEGLGDSIHNVVNLRIGVVSEGAAFQPRLSDSSFRVPSFLPSSGFHEKLTLLMTLT